MFIFICYASFVLHLFYILCSLSECFSFIRLASFRFSFVFLLSFLFFFQVSFLNFSLLDVRVLDPAVLSYYSSSTEAGQSVLYKSFLCQFGLWLSTGQDKTIFDEIQRTRCPSIGFRGRFF